MVDGQAPEPALELVAVDDRAQALRPRRFLDRKEMEAGCPRPDPATLCVAGAQEEPV